MRTPNTNVRTRQGRPAGRLLAIALLAGGLAACSDPMTQPGERAVPDGPSMTLNPACHPGLGGVTHSDSVLAPETWSRADNPHRVNSVLPIQGAGVLTLAPGVVVCFSSMSSLHASNGGRLVMNGLDTARIVLTAYDPAYGWWGVHMGGNPGAPSTVKHVRLEYGGTAGPLSSYGNHAVLIDSTVFRQNAMGIDLAGKGSAIRRSRVDTVTMPGHVAVTLGSNTTFEKTEIRGAAGVGMAVVGTTGVAIHGGRIEGSGGVGLMVSTPGYAITTSSTLRVVGGASYPAEMVVSAVSKLYPGPSQQDSLLGNARDTLVVTGGILQWYVHPNSRIPWRVTGDITVQWVGILHAGPGASLSFTAYRGITARGGGTIVARGTKAAPVLFTAADSQGWSGISLEGAPSAASYLTNVRIEHVKAFHHHGVFAQDSHTVVIDSAVFRQNVWPVGLVSPGSRISRSRVDTTLSPNPAVELASNAKIESTLIRGSAGGGLRVHTATAQIVSCEIRGSADYGIQLLAAAPVHDCSLVDNGGPGIENLAPATADVENNWWGDAAGPTGTNGDGVSGPLDHTPWRTTPFVLPYVP